MRISVFIWNCSYIKDTFLQKLYHMAYFCFTLCAKVEHLVLSFKSTGCPFLLFYFKLDAPYAFDSHIYCLESSAQTS
jgi:hypothetical protein